MKNWSLRTRFILFALACLVPFAAVMSYAVDRELDRRIEQTLVSQSAIASSVSRSLSSFLSTNANALEGIAQLPSVVSLNPEESEIALGQARGVRPELSGIFLIDTEQQIVARSGADPETLLAYISPQLDQTVAQNVVTISQRIEIEDDVNAVVMLVPVTTVQTTETTTTAAATDQEGSDTDEVGTDPTTIPEAGTESETEQATQPPGRTIGVVGGIIQVERMSQTVLPSNRGSYEIAVASVNEVLFSTGGIDRNTTLLLSDEADNLLLTLEGENTEFEMADVNGVERTVIGVPVGYEFAEWAVLVTQPVPGILDGISGIELIVVLALCVLVILALAMVMSELTARPLRTLSRQAQELHRGTLKEPIVPLGGGEIRTLSERFAEMSGQIKTQVAGLEENQHERERQAAQMRDLLRRTNRMQEDERRRIAGEIHDAVSPLITGALYQARALQMTNGSTPEEEMESSLRSVSQLLEQATDELHGVIFELRPPDLDDLGLVAAIEAYVHTVQRTGLSCRLEVSGEPPNLTPEVRLSLYRIVQEALHNVVRHAGADEAVVRLETTEEVVRLTVRDNGAGFDPVQAVQPTSLGLLSMQERAEAIGATFTIVSKPGGGTALVIERPNSGDVMSDEVLESMMSMSNGTHAVAEPVEDGEVDTPLDAQPSEPIR